MAGRTGLRLDTAEISGEVTQHWRLLAFQGVMLAIFGCISILLPGLAIVAVNLLLGWLFLGIGVLGFASTLMARSDPGFWWAAASAVASLIAGIILTVWPLRGFYAVSVVLAGFLVFDGALTIMYGIAHKQRLSRGWRWLVVNGAIDLFLAPLIIFVTFVTVEIWLLPDVIGIDMLVGGGSLLAVALAARSK